MRISDWSSDVCSSDLIDLPPERRRLGYVFQEGRLFPHLSVRHNLLYGFRRAPAAERPLGLERVIALLGIEPLLERRPGSLSGGEKQRVALGRSEARRVGKCGSTCRSRWSP